jgi:16S rRNA (adenine1518-N6/adenine1519-N6)-dimethyltransferase
MHQPRKRFGQHFLHDPAIIERIVAAVAPERGQHVLEIGPGLGAITVPLLRRLDQLHAVEIDRDAARVLEERYAGSGLVLHRADVLDFRLAEVGSPMPLRVVGNLPYNISTPLLFHLLRQREHILDMHFMLQKEVVARMAATAGAEAYGRLTVMLAPWTSVEPLFDIGPGAFRPPPRVDSTFVRLRPHVQPALPIADAASFAAVVAAAFAQRRKTLRNALRPLLSDAQIRSVGIDPGARAEVIPPAGFAALAEVLAAAKRAGLHQADGAARS